MIRLRTSARGLSSADALERLKLYGPSAFGFVALTAPVVGSMILIVAAYVLATEIAKLKLLGTRRLPRKRREEGRPRPRSR